MKNNDMYSARCKACNALFHPVWIEERKCFEELCWTCLPIALGYNEPDDMSELADLFEGNDKDYEYE